MHLKLAKQDGSDKSKKVREIGSCIANMIVQNKCREYDNSDVEKMNVKVYLLVEWSSNKIYYNDPLMTMFVSHGIIRKSWQQS